MTAVKQPQILKDLIKTLPFIDPDSSRMVEWIWANRQLAGLSTAADVFLLPRKVLATHGEIAEILKSHFEQYYLSDKLFRGLRVNAETEVVEFYAVLEKISDGAALNVFGDSEEVTALMTLLRERYTEPHSVVIESLLGFGENGPIKDSNELLERDQCFGTDSFYPWLEGGIDAFVAKYQKSKANVILLIGPPGTGKSTFLRTLLFKLNRPKIGLVSNETALTNPALVTWLQALGHGAVVGIEDADNLVAARDKGNSQMSMLLNYVEGVVNHDTKVIISTNLSGLNLVDEALVRAGRTFQILNFRLLTGLEANVARQSIGLESVDLHDNIKLTLASALNFDDSIDSRKRQGMGFK